MIRYLLCDSSEEEKSHLEERLFRDEQYFNQLQIVEDQLIDDYLENKLPPGQRQKFESNYLISERRKQKLQFAKTLKESLATLPALQFRNHASSGGNSLLAVWQRSLWQFGFAASATVLLLLGSWVYLRSNQRIEVSTNQTVASPSPMTASPNAQSAELSKPLQPTPSQAPARRPVPPRQPAKTNVSVTMISVLSPGLWRDQENKETANTIIVNSQLKRLILQLKHQPATKFSVYRASLETATGQSLLTRDNLKPNAQFLRLQLPAQSLAADDYVITVFGKNGEGQFEEINEYSFRVIKR